MGTHGFQSTVSLVPPETTGVSPGYAISVVWEWRGVMTMVEERKCVPPRSTTAEQSARSPHVSRACWIVAKGRTWEP